MVHCAHVRLNPTFRSFYDVASSGETLFEPHLDVSRVYRLDVDAPRVRQGVDL